MFDYLICQRVENFRTGTIMINDHLLLGIASGFVRLSKYSLTALLCYQVQLGKTLSLLLLLGLGVGEGTFFNICLDGGPIEPSRRLPSPHYILVTTNQQR
jgi:hypothetical protein